MELNKNLNDLHLGLTEPNVRKRSATEKDKSGKDKRPKNSDNQVDPQKGSEKSKKNNRKSSEKSKQDAEGDSEEHTSDVEDPNSNWALTLPYWPLETRQPIMQNKTVVNAMDRNHLFKIMELDQNQRKQEKAENMEVFRNDDQIPLTKYKEGKDDRRKRFHPASFLRLPVCDQSVYWDQIPVKRTPLFRNIQLKPTGSEHQISDKAVEFLHNRSAMISLKLFLPENINVTSKPLREVKKYEDQGLCTTTELQWENATSISQIKEALISYGICLQQLWPGDTSAWSMMKLLDKYKYLANVTPNKVWIQIITNFFNKVARENASRAASQDPPLFFDKLEVILKASLTRQGYIFHWLLILFPGFPSLFVTSSLIWQGCIFGSLH